MSKKQGAVGISKIISYFFIVLVVISVCGFLAFFTNGFTSDFKTFYVSVDGNDILTTTNGYVITTDKEMQVDIKYTFGSLAKEVSGYSVKVIPNSITGKDFDFTIDGSAYSYQAEKDLTAGFEIVKSENSFTIKPKGGITEILAAVYPQSEIGECRSNAYEDMFCLIVSSYNNEKSVTINFSVIEKISGVQLDEEVIIF